MQNQHIIDFFRALSERMYKENDLSDILYALCESSRDFRQFFLDFFFPKNNLLADDVSIFREIQYEDGSRPDFTIVDSKNGLFLVENKIDDHNHHFAQYESVLTRELGKMCGNLGIAGRLGYITNYKLSEDEQRDANNCKALEQNNIHTWKDFIEGLKQQQRNQIQWTLCESIEGFISYCSKVCPNDEEEVVGQFCLDCNVFSLVKKGYQCLRKFLYEKQTIKGHSVQYYQKCNRAEDWTGFYFSVDNVKLLGGRPQKLYGWIGWYLRANSTSPGLCIEFLNKKGWGGPVFDVVKTKDRYQLDYCFNLSDCIDCGELREKEFAGVVNKAFSETFEAIESGKGPNNNCQTPKEFLEIRNLCLFLKQNIIAKQDKSNKYILEVASISDSQVTDKWCGVYFNILEKSHPVRQGWIGVYYDGKERGHDKSGDGRMLVCDYAGQVRKLACQNDNQPLELDANTVLSKLKECL